MMSQNESDKQNWLGNSYDEICNHNPWSFSTSPINPSKYHYVLYELPVDLQTPPKPHKNINLKHWEDDFVRMPYSSNSLFVIEKNDEDIVKPRWDIIREALTQPITCIEELEKAIHSYNKDIPKFQTLCRFFNYILDEEESNIFFVDLLPKMIKLALDLPNILPGNLPFLKRNHCKSISLSQLQISSLLANAFFCTFLWRRDLSNRFPYINFIKLFSTTEKTDRLNCIFEKLKCIFHYFKKVTTYPPIGCVTFERKFIHKTVMPRWDSLNNNLGNTKIHISSIGTIEDCSGLLQVDFANKFIGGGVLAYGCVQEEIRFIICPELIISRLFTEQLGDNEAITVTGVERFSNYKGYGYSFQWDGNHIDETPFDEYGRRKTNIVVIDATYFNNSSDQFRSSAILRELNKAYVGFSSREKQNLSPIATGNWGCGAFGGSISLKSLIQLMACNAANRNFVYCAFGNENFRNEFYDFYLFLAKYQITICELWRCLCRFCVATVPEEKLYSFIQQAYFDIKSQSIIKDNSHIQIKTTQINLNEPSTSSFSIQTSPVLISTEIQSPSSTLTKTLNTSKYYQRYKPLDNIKIEKKIAIKEKIIQNNTDDIIDIINQIDEPVKKKSDNFYDQSISLLDKLDEFKTIKIDKKESINISNNNLKIIDKRKRKITDFFMKTEENE